MIVLYKILVISILVMVFIQDYKDRMVYWFLYPLIGVFGLLIMLDYQPLILAFTTILINLLLVLTILLIMYLYSILIMKKKIAETFGFGDMLFFVFLSFCFSNISFIILFVFSLFFSLMISLVFKDKQHNKTIPLAGYMSLFFAFVYFVSFFDAYSNLFTY